jgi:hypothetical protein
MAAIQFVIAADMPASSYLVPVQQLILTSYIVLVGLGASLNPIG